MPAEKKSVFGKRGAKAALDWRATVPKKRGCNTANEFYGVQFQDLAENDVESSHSPIPGNSIV